MSQATVAVTVIGLQGRTLANTAPTTNQALMWNGTAWLPSGPFLPLTGGTLTGNIITSGNIVASAANMFSPGAGGSYLNASGVNIRTGRAAVSKNGLSTQFTTASSALVMAGMAAQFTPQLSGTVFIGVSCQIAVNTASGNANACTLYGTGTPPAQGAAQVGNAPGYGPSFQANANTGGVWVPWSQKSVSTGLTVGTQYWADLGLGTQGGPGNAYAQWCSIWVQEL